MWRFCPISIPKAFPCIFPKVSGSKDFIHRHLQPLEQSVEAGESDALLTILQPEQ